MEIRLITYLRILFIKIFKCYDPIGMNTEQLNSA